MLKPTKRLVWVASVLMMTSLLTACTDGKEKDIEDNTIKGSGTVIEKEKVLIDTSLPKEDKQEPEISQQIGAVEPVILDGEPMDDHSEWEPTLHDNEKVGYIKKVERDQEGKVTLHVDFAELDYDKKYVNGYKLENKEVKAEQMTFDKDPMYFILKGDDLLEATIEDIEATKLGNVLFTFLHTDEGAVFLIEERYFSE